MRNLLVEFPQPCGERWDDMARQGCNRHCASCDTTIYDLESYSFDEVEALTEQEGPICVRARLALDGTVALRPSVMGRAGRLVVAVSAGVLAAASPALAEAGGKLVGHIDSGFRVKVTAKDADGRSYRAAVRQDGRFWFKKLPPGDYVVTARGCSNEWTVGKASIRSGTIELPKSVDPDDCIIVGVMEIKDREG